MGQRGGKLRHFPLNVDLWKSACQDIRAECRNDTEALECQAVYLTLLIHLFEHGGVLRDEEHIRAIVGIDKRQVRRIFGVLRPKFRRNKAGIYHEVIARLRKNRGQFKDLWENSEGVQGGVQKGVQTPEGNSTGIGYISNLSSHHQDTNVVGQSPEQRCDEEIFEIPRGRIGGIQAWVNWFTQRGMKHLQANAIRSRSIFGQWVEDGVTEAEVLDAWERARASLGEYPRHPAYLEAIIAERRRTGGPEPKQTREEAEKAFIAELGIEWYNPDGSLKNGDGPGGWKQEPGWVAIQAWFETEEGNHG